MQRVELQRKMGQREYVGERHLRHWQAVQPSHSRSVQIIEQFLACCLTQLTIFFPLNLGFSFSSSNIYLTLSDNCPLLFHKCSMCRLKESQYQEIQISRTKGPDFKATSPHQEKWLPDSQHELHCPECFCTCFIYGGWKSRTY